MHAIKLIHLFIIDCHMHKLVLESYTVYKYSMYQHTKFTTNENLERIEHYYIILYEEKNLICRVSHETRSALYIQYNRTAICNEIINSNSFTRAKWILDWWGQVMVKRGKCPLILCEKKQFYIIFVLTHYGEIQNIFIISQYQLESSRSSARIQYILYDEFTLFK